MWWAIFKYVVAVFIFAGVSTVLSDSAHAWQQHIPPKFIVSDVSSSNVYACSGRWSTISVNGQGSIEACVMGNDVKIASYFPIDGPISYAIQFPSDTKFFPLDVCTGFWGCIYSEVNDSFVGFSWVSPSENRATIYKNFVKNLSRSSQNGLTRYGLSDQSQSFPIEHPSGTLFFAQTAAVSNNGRWVFLEIRNYGFFRVDMQTYETRRIIAPGIQYTSYGPQAAVQLAISNDGSVVAVMGQRMGLWIVMVNDTCGDTLTYNTQVTFIGAVTPCQFVGGQPEDYIDNFLFAVKPRFSDDSKTLTFDIYGQGVQARKITLLSDTSEESLSHYVAIGDSFTSGEGEVNDSFYIGGATNKCHVSSRSYPFLLGNTRGVQVHNAACSGATIETARQGDPKKGRSSQLNEIESRLPQLLTVGIGGNDAGLMGKLKNCLGLDTCEWARSADERKNTANEIKNVYPKLRLFYEDLKLRTPGKIVVVGYPKIISTEALCLADIGIVLDQTERQFMNEGIAYLNQVIRAAANDSGIEYVNIEEVFNGNKLCDLSLSPSMNGVRFGKDYPIIDALSNLKVFSAESFHPTPEGHKQIATFITERFSNVLSASHCVTCSNVKGVPPIGSYWNGDTDTQVHQRTLPFLSKVTVKKGDVFEISLPAFSFQPGSSVTLELHSDIRTLGTITAAEDGSLRSNVEVTDFEPGFHSVQAIGVNANGEKVKVYDFIEIKEETIEVVDEDIVDNGLAIQSIEKLEASKNSERKFAPRSFTEVLGTSAVYMPTLPVNPVKNETKTLQITKEGTLNLVLYTAIGILSGIVIGGGVVLLYSRRKHA